MERHPRDIGSLLFQARKHIFGKVKAGSRTSCAPGRLCIHVLIALRIGSRIASLDVGRKRYVTVFFKPAFGNRIVKLEVSEFRSGIFSLDNAEDTVRKRVTHAALLLFCALYHRTPQKAFFIDLM